MNSGPREFPNPKWLCGLAVPRSRRSKLHSSLLTIHLTHDKPHCQTWPRASRAYCLPYYVHYRAGRPSLHTYICSVRKYARCYARFARAYFKCTSSSSSDWQRHAREFSRSIHPSSHPSVRLSVQPAAYHLNSRAYIWIHTHIRTYARARS